MSGRCAPPPVITQPGAVPRRGGVQRPGAGPGVREDAGNRPTRRWRRRPCWSWGAHHGARRAQLPECGRRGEGDRPAVAPAAMVPVHPQRFQQPGTPRAGRPHGHRRHGVAPFVVRDQAAGVGVRRGGGDRVPGVLREGRVGERGPLHGAAHPRIVRSGHLDPYARAGHRSGEVTVQRCPRLVVLPAGVGEGLPDQRAPRGLDVHRPLGQDTPPGVREVRGEPPRHVLVPPGVGREGQTQQVGAVQQADGDGLSAPPPHPDRLGGRAVTEPQEPAHVPGCSCTGAPSCCHSRSARTASSSPPAPAPPTSGPMPTSTAMPR